METEYTHPLEAVCENPYTEMNERRAYLIGKIHALEKAKEIIKDEFSEHEIF